MPSAPGVPLVAAVAFGVGAAVATWWHRRGKAASEKPPPLKLPTLLRRSTLLVSDIDRSLRLYRDILGMEVVFDKVLPITGKGLPTGVFDAQGRLVFLRTHDDHQVGVVGLLSYLDKPIPKPAQGPRRKLQVGDAVLLLNTTDVDARMSKIKALPGVYVQSEGTISTYPNATGGSVTVIGNSFFDADGHFVELNQVRDGST